MTSEPPSQTRTPYRQVMAVSRFRLLLAASALTGTADSLRIATLAILVYTRTGSALLGAVTFGIGFVPQVVGSTLLGALSDRIPPRRLITSGYMFECAAATLLALADLPVWACLVLVAVVACLTPVAGGASNRLLGETLTGDSYVLGRSLLNMVSSSTQLIGLAAGGIAVTVVGPHHALLVGALAYAVAAALVRTGLPRLPTPGRTASGHPADGGFRSVVHDSLSSTRRLLADVRVRRLLIAFWLPAGFVAGAEGLIVPYAGESGFWTGSSAWLLASLPSGMLIGDLVTGRLMSPAARKRAVVPLMALLGTPLIVFFSHPPYALCVVLLVATGMGFAYGLGLQRAFLDSVAEPRQGQAFGLLASGLMTLQGVGPAVFGGLAQMTTAATAMACAGLATLATAAWAASISLTGLAVSEPQV
ncbi:MFS family permease [Kitasatospora sp. GAS204A]|uniref:MFS transporter n=1 Tax=unclassified Kitasatospora TaxID=2633591 RepID=UPI002475CF46|nr:MFS transporter [Kitasatospora sp. GAS204B]MDH6117073.1 MFS family permease [Kitasatospora sp. GAS204B]